jgi:SAM-dependent methyltransferase
MSQEDYLLANQPSELERLQLQARVWEPSGRQLLSKVGDGSGRRALDVGCGALGWLRILSEWVGPSGHVVGLDIDETLLDAARSFLAAEEGISNVGLVVDDLFENKQAPHSFDLVHARYQIAPLGRGAEQVAAYQRLVRPGGSLVLEEWDLGSWHFNPPAPAAERLVRSLSEIFASLGGEAGRGLPELLGKIGVEAEIDAHVIALKPGHPYLRLPLQFSVALESRLLETLGEEELASLRREAETELAEPGRWGTTFTLIQSWGMVEG